MVMGYIGINWKNDQLMIFAPRMARGPTVLSWVLPLAGPAEILGESSGVEGGEYYLHDSSPLK